MCERLLLTVIEQIPQFDGRVVRARCQLHGGRREVQSTDSRLMIFQDQCQFARVDIPDVDLSIRESSSEKQTLREIVPAVDHR